MSFLFLSFRISDSNTTKKDEEIRKMFFLTKTKQNTNIHAANIRQNDYINTISRYKSALGNGR